MKHLKLKKFNLKKLFFTVSILLIFNISAFAKSGFEFILSVPLGGNYAYPSENMKINVDYVKYEMRGFFGFDIGVISQLGYMFQIKDNFAISVLGEIGYARDNYKFEYNEHNHGGSYGGNFTINHDSFQIGLLPKLNIKGFSIGIGGGIKIPISFTYEEEETYNSPTWYSISGNGSVGYYGKLTPKVNRDYKIIYYTKITFDYSLFFNENLAFNIGLYFGYDFFPKYQILAFNYYPPNTDMFIHSGEGYYVEKAKNYGTLNFGVQLGLRFGPRV